jgi:hypothetical protein
MISIATIWFVLLIDVRNIVDVIDAQLVAFSDESKFQVIVVSDIFSAIKVKVSDSYINIFFFIAAN